MSNDHEKIAQALAAPFDEAEIKFRPGAITGRRALALPYVDARVIQDRLDAVLGAIGWQDAYECLPDGCVVCRLSLRLGDEWIQKMDVGSPSEQADEGDRRKAAFSDALKRAAVKFGIGRYLYQLPAIWAEYDPQRRQFVRKPTLPGTRRTPEPVTGSPVTGPRPADQVPAERRTDSPQTAGWGKLTRPPEIDQDPAEQIAQTQVAYLRQEIVAARADLNKLLRHFLGEQRESYGPWTLGDLCLGQYRVALELLERKKNKA